MKQKVTLLVFAFALTLSLHATSSVSMSNDTIISSFGGIIPPPGGWGGGGPHHAPANVSVPTVVFDDYTLLFIGTGEVSLTYSVVDEYEEEWISGTLSLSNGDEEPVDVSALPAGTYTLILGIAGREYEGEFEIE